MQAVFVRNRVVRIAEKCEVKVLAPIPYFPLATLLPKYAHRRQIPHRDHLGSLDVRYPRFLSVPKFLRPLDGFFLFLSLLLTVLRLRRAFDFDLIDAHLAFPDGFACLLLARLLGKPLSVTLRGHDINLLPKYPIRRWQIRRVLRGADRVIAVAAALRQAAVALGCDPNKTAVVSNGVDPELFFPADRAHARRTLRLPPDRKIILSVGHLVERKGFHLVTEALRRLRSEGMQDTYYVIVGGPGAEGNVSEALHTHIRRLGMEEHVLLAGPQRNENLRDWYNAADVFCLASSREGWANVLLESLACGTPVVATMIWGTPEVIASDEYGLLVERTPEAIATGLRAALGKAWDRGVIAAYARSQTWDVVSDRVLDNLRLAIQQHDEHAHETRVR